MSVASEFPPVVVIPERARRTGGVALAPDRRHLRAVDGIRAYAERPSIAPTRRVARVTELFPAPLDLPVSAACVESAAGDALARDVAPVRLTRRGVLVLAAVVGLLGALLLLVAHASVGSAAATPTAGASTFQVHAGDTLWSIARSIAPNRDPRLVVDQLIARNRLTTVSLIPGQTLNVK